MSIPTSRHTDWIPRYYYIMQNKTSGKKYVGQTTRDISKYLGSGSYWKPHCKKHGGYNKKNIILLNYRWVETEQEAKNWINSFEKVNPNYWLLEEWANQCREDTYNNPFQDIKVQKTIRNKKTIDQIEYVTKCLVEGGKKTRFGTKEYNKIIQDKYGVDNVAKVPEIVQRRSKKQSITKKLNGTAKGSNNSNAKNVIVNGMSFGTMKDAAIYFNISMHYLRKHNKNNIITVNIEELRARTKRYGRSS